MHYISYANRRDPDSKREGQLAANKKREQQYQLNKRKPPVLKPQIHEELLSYKGKIYAVTRCKNGELHLKPLNLCKKKK